MKKKLISLLVGILYLLNFSGVCSFFMSICNFFNLDTNWEGFFIIILFIGDAVFLGNLQKIDDYLSDKIKVDDVLEKLNRLNYLDYSNLKKIEHFTIEKRSYTSHINREETIEYYELVTHIKNKHLINITTGEESVEEHGLLFERINDLSQIPSTQEELEQLDKKYQEAENNRKSKNE